MTIHCAICDRPFSSLRALGGHVKQSGHKLTPSPQAPIAESGQEESPEVVETEGYAEETPDEAEEPPPRVAEPVRAPPIPRSPVEEMEAWLERHEQHERDMEVLREKTRRLRFSYEVMEVARRKANEEWDPNRALEVIQLGKVLSRAATRPAPRTPSPSESR